MLFHDDGSVKGVATTDVGVAKDGSPKVHMVATYSDVPSVLPSAISAINCHQC